MARVAGRKSVFAWLDDPDGLQKDISKEDYMRLMALNEITWRFFEKEWNDIRNRKADKARLIANNLESTLGEVEPLDEEDPVGWWKRNGRGVELNKAIFKSATEKLNPNSMKLAKQLAGELVEKQEVTHYITADEHYRIRAEAQRRIQESLGNPDGNRSLLAKPSLLSEEVCVDNQQEHSESNQVASVAVST